MARIICDLKSAKPVLGCLSAIFYFCTLIIITNCSIDGETVAGDTTSGIGALYVEDKSDELFDRSQLLAVDINIAAEDYQQLRDDGRNADTIFSNCIDEFHYKEFNATVTIDGERVEDVSIRKKGFLGSLSRNRPSFKLNFSTLRPGREFKSMQRMTLNNDRTDPSHSHQCTTYQLFRAAGLAAPRCNWAMVTVNGENLGIYSHIESIKKPFLTRNFTDDSGNLYEAQGADFLPNLQDNFQLKTNEQKNNRADLDRVVKALQADDNEFPAALNKVIDINEYITFWAMEIITSHWDSATGNANNYYIYHNPLDNLFHFIPWGTDDSLSGSHLLSPESGPLFRYTEISARLYAIPEYRNRLHNRIQDLLSSIWDEQTLLTQIDQIQRLTDTPVALYEPVKDFFSKQQDQLQRAINGEITQNERRIEDSAATCATVKSTIISGSFNGNQGSFQFIDDKGETISIESGLTFTIIANATSPSTVIIGIAGSVAERSLLATVSIEVPDYQPGVIPTHGVANSIFLLDISNGNYTPVGFAGVGTITLEEAGQAPKGSFSATFAFTDENPLVGADTED